MEWKKIKFGRKTVRVGHDNFEYYQPNSHIAGDCAVRAVAKATNQSWYSVYDALVPLGRKAQRMPNETEVIGEYLVSKGFKWVAVDAEGRTRPTVAEFAKSTRKPCVMRVANHLTSCQDGKYYDIWDCGEKSLYGYWVKA